MANAITVKALQDASLDAKSLEEVVNGNDAKQVTTRLGETYPSVKKSIKTLFENGGLPAAPFATKALMTASSLVNGKYAMVTDDTANNGLYIKTVGAWVKSAYDPTTLSKDYTDTKISERIYTENTSSNVFEFVDDAEKIGVSIDTDANINANNIYTDDIPNAAFVIIDEGGNAAVVIEKITGNLINPVTEKLKADVLSLQQNGVGTTNAPESLSQPKADLMHIFSYGQSLSRGARATPVISNVQPYNNLTFASGVIPKVDVGHDYTSFKPLVEQVFGVEGETPTSGMLNNFVATRVDKGEVAEKWQFVGTAPGQEGQAIAGLVKGTANYSGMLTQAQSAYDIAQAQGKTYSVWAMAWTQGENDYAGAGTPQATYLAALLQLRDDFTADVKVITNQSFDVPIVMYQTAAHRQTNYQKNTMFVALAQLQAANENNDIIMACPIYNLPHYTDNLHLTADSSYRLGRYYAKALEHTLYNVEKWQPLQPKNIFKQGKIIDIEFNKSGLVIDTTLVTATHNMGFDLWSGGVLLDTITSVTLTDTNRVRLVLSAIPSVGTILSYARGRVGDPAAAGPVTGARGNLRDNAGDTDNYQDSTGTTRYMHNWCAMFEKTI